MNRDLEATVERCRTGDDAAWSALVSATIGPIYRLCASYARSNGEAEELTQEVYLKLWQNLDRYRAGSSFKAWAWQVARNLLIDSYRRHRRERSHTWLEPEVLDSLPGGDDPHQRAERTERLRLLALGLTQLDDDLSELILMRDLAGFSYNEIADALDLPLGTVKSRLNRARLELATAVRRRLQLRAVDGDARVGGAS